MGGAYRDTCYEIFYYIDKLAIEKGLYKYNGKVHYIAFDFSILKDLKLKIVPDIRNSLKSLYRIPLLILFSLPAVTVNVSPFIMWRLL